MLKQTATQYSEPIAVSVTPNLKSNAANPHDPQKAPNDILAARVELVSDSFLEFVPLEYAREHLILSQGIDEEGIEIVAISRRDSDAVVVHNLRVRFPRPIRTKRYDPESIAKAIDELAQQAQSPSSYANSNDTRADDLASFEESDLEEILASDERDLLRTTGRAPVVKLVNGLLFEAMSRRASDVHVQGAPNATIVRYRVDGVLAEARRLPKALLAPIVSRVKVMAHMDIAEKRLPQDGRAGVTIGDAEIDLRVSSLPTATGERLVIRLLDKRRREFFAFENLGMPQSVRDRFERVCQRTQGIVLVTGPTGSGKTTTLYSALTALNSDELNVMTLEDPIEYELPGISQSQINLKKGVTFATGLRHILRQDPDVIMVGEIRDAETARIAIQASLTGHLVFSTLHTNSAASAVTRLIDLGVEPYLINASLAAVLAQRLVRTVCERCCRGLTQSPSATCELCLGSGMAGRMGLFELLLVNDGVRELVHSGAGAREIERAARGHGMVTLRDAGFEAARGGLTTCAEVERVTLIDEDDVMDRGRSAT